MFTIFSDIRNIVHREFVSQDLTVNRESYWKILRRLRKNIPPSRRDLLQEKKWNLLECAFQCFLINAPLVVCELLSNRIMLWLPHLSYWSDLFSVYSFLFPMHHSASTRRS
ncbi:hypothetical protein AVEN_235392-1 [Araneus ventricosus]|uniref:Uncharacterized protein n=1 Tax=Araneus ventricosus TaxID=182803 RepID=A0A4Y2A3R6_ARAVE|nr:hypothetical protein AVEN_235392-1 [Araneus ventricosus]